MMPAVCGTRSSAPMVATAWRSDSRGAPAAGGGSCIHSAMAPQDSAAQAASTQKPMRQELTSISQASGVPVTSMPRPPTARMMLDTMV